MAVAAAQEPVGAQDVGEPVGVGARSVGVVGADQPPAGRSDLSVGGGGGDAEDLVGAAQVGLVVLHDGRSGWGGSVVRWLRGLAAAGFGLGGVEGPP